MNETTKEGWIVGVWNLVSFTVTSSNGFKAYPLGKRPLGRLIYAENGYMSANLSKHNRDKFKSDITSEATMYEWGIAAADYMSYTGKYFIRDNCVVHKVDMSLFPNWEGTDLIRNFQYADNILTLSLNVETHDANVDFLGELVWIKLDND